MRQFCKFLIAIFCIIVFLLTAKISFGQMVINNTGSPNVLNREYNRQVTKILIIPLYNDTTSALASIDSLGMIIIVRTTGKMYKRDSITSGHKWTEVGSGTGGGVGTLTQVTANGNGTPHGLRVVDISDSTKEYVAIFYNGSHEGEIDLENSVGGVTSFHMDSIVRRGNTLKFPTGPGTFALLTDLSSKKDNTDSVAVTGYSTRGRLQKVLDSILIVINTSISTKKDNSDSTITTGYSTRGRLYKVVDSILSIINTSIATKITNGGGATKITVGVYSSRPTASNCQCFYVATDSLKNYYDNGAWLTIGGGSGGGGASNPFADNIPIVKNNADNTKTVTIDASGVSASTNRTLTAPDASGTIVLNNNTATLSGKTIAAGSNTISGLTNTHLSGSAGITNANLNTMPAHTHKANITASTATPTDITNSQLAAELFTGSANQIVATPDNSSGPGGLRPMVVRDLPATKTWPDQTPMATIFDQTYFTSNDAGRILVNASGGTNSTVTFSGGLMGVTASNPAYTNYNFYNPWYLTMTNHFSYSNEFTVVVAGNGYSVVDRDPSVGLLGYLSCTIGASTINLMNQNGSVLATAVAGPTIVLNHKYKLTLSLNDSVATVSAQDLTTGGSVSSLSTNLTIAANLSPRMGNLGFFAFSGTYNVSRITFSSTDIKNTNIDFLGDSKIREYSPTYWNTRWAVQVGANYPNYAIYAGTSMKITDLLALAAGGELAMLNGQTIVLSIGSNDVRATGFTDKVATDYARLVNWFKAGGSRVIHVIEPEDSTAGGVGLTAFKNWIAATWPSDYIDVWTGMTTSGDNKLKSSMKAADGIHPNQVGHDYIATTVIASGFLTTLDPTRRSQFRTNDGLVRWQGDSLYLAFQIMRRAGYMPYWNIDGNMSISPFQYNGTTGGYNSTRPFTPTTGAGFSFNEGIALGGTLGGLYFESRNGTPGVPVYSPYVLSNTFRSYNNTRSKDLDLKDSIGRVLTGIGKAVNSLSPSAYLDFAQSDGTPGNAPMKIRAGTIMATPEANSVEHDNTNWLVTDNSGVRDTIALRAWVRSNFGSAGATNITVTRNATDVTVASSTGTAGTLATADATHAGALDTARAKFIDSLKLRLVNDPQNVGNIGSGWPLLMVRNDSLLLKTIKCNGCTVSSQTDSTITIDLSPMVQSGSFLPVSSGNTNIASITIDSASYTVNGNIVTGRFSGTVTATTGAVAILLHLTLPVTNITWNSGTLGTGSWTDLTTGLATPIMFSPSSATNSVAQFIPSSTNGGVYVITYQYDAR